MFAAIVCVYNEKLHKFEHRFFEDKHIFRLKDKISYYQNPDVLASVVRFERMVDICD